MAYRINIAIDSESNKWLQLQFHNINRINLLPSPTHRSHTLTAKIIIVGLEIFASFPIISFIDDNADVSMRYEQY